MCPAPNYQGDPAKPAWSDIQVVHQCSSPLLVNLAISGYFRVNQESQGRFNQPWANQGCWVSHTRHPMDSVHAWQGRSAQYFPFGGFLCERSRTLASHCNFPCMFHLRTVFLFLIIGKSTVIHMINHLHGMHDFAWLWNIYSMASWVNEAMENVGGYFKASFSLLW